MKTPSIDRIGMFLSSLCLVHCILLPVLLLLLPAVATNFIGDHGTVHTVLFGLVTTAALFAFTPGYRVHRHLGPCLISIVGIGLLFIATFYAHETVGHDGETPLSVVGSLILIAAHFVNHKLCNKCTSHSCKKDHHE